MLIEVSKGRWINTYHIIEIQKDSMGSMILTMMTHSLINLTATEGAILEKYLLVEGEAR